MKSIDELNRETLNKTSKEPSLQKLREEFNKKCFNNGMHPKTSHKYKRSIDHSSYNLDMSKKYNSAIKALSANKLNLKSGSIYKFDDKEFLDFYRKHPGYLYYKEVLLNMKSKQFRFNKQRTFTGKDMMNKMKFGNTNYTFDKAKSTNKFPKIIKINKKTKTHHIRKYIYNFNYNNYVNNQNNNYNINNMNININIKGKSNPYSLYWVNKILGQNSFKLGIKKKSNGMSKIISLNKNENITNKMFKNNKLLVNNFVNKEKEKEINKEKKDEIPNKNTDNDNDDLDEEQQMQFYKNQKNFFKARKDIKEEPEDLEEDIDEDKDKNKDKNVNKGGNNEIK